VSRVNNIKNYKMKIFIIEMEGTIQNNISSDMPSEIEELFREIWFINRLEINHKINIKSKTYSPINTGIARKLWEGGQRLLDGDSKEATTKWLDYLIKKSIRLGKKYPEWGDKIIKELQDMPPAMNNLLTVYKDYPSIVGDLELILFKIEPTNFIKALKQNIEKNENMENNENNGGLKKPINNDKNETVNSNGLKKIISEKNISKSNINIDENKDEFIITVE